MRDSNKYDGNQVVIHTIKQGETLSAIAQRYHFKSWTPIWAYNTEIRHVFEGSPDSIQGGVSIFIPRSEEGYKHLIIKFKSLEGYIKNAGDREMYLLDADYYRFLANRVLLDAGGDGLQGQIGRSNDR